MVFFLSSLANSMTKWAQMFTGLLFYALLCWDISSENTGLWQLPNISSAFNTKLEISGVSQISCCFTDNVSGLSVFFVRRRILKKKKCLQYPDTKTPRISFKKSQLLVIDQFSLFYIVHSPFTFTHLQNTS